MAKAPDTPQGTLDLLILKTLQRGPNHGFGITLHIHTVSDGLLRVEEGSLYPALHRLEKSHRLRSSWQITENGRRARVYELTGAGREQLVESEEKWRACSAGIERVLGWV